MSPVANANLRFLRAHPHEHELMTTLKEVEMSGR